MEGHHGRHGVDMCLLRVMIYTAVRGVLPCRGEGSKEVRSVQRLVNAARLTRGKIGFGNSGSRPVLTRSLRAIGGVEVELSILHRAFLSWPSIATIKI